MVLIMVYLATEQEEIALRTDRRARSTIIVEGAVLESPLPTLFNDDTLLLVIMQSTVAEHGIATPGDMYSRPATGENITVLKGSPGVICNNDAISSAIMQCTVAQRRIGIFALDRDRGSCLGGEIAVLDHELSPRNGQCMIGLFRCTGLAANGQATYGGPLLLRASYRSGRRVRAQVRDG